MTKSSNQTSSPSLRDRVKLRHDLHLARKIWHISMGLAIVLVYDLTGMSQAMAALILGLILALFVIGESLRLFHPGFNEFAVKFWGPLMRTSEIKQMSGVPFYVCAAMLAVGIFPKPIAILSVLYLAFGDPVASLVGILWGDLGPRFQNKKKSLIGTMAGVLVCILITWIYLYHFISDGWSLLFIALGGGLAGGLAELLPMDVDDNFSIPLVSGFTLWILFILNGLPL